MCQVGIWSKLKEKNSSVRNWPCQIWPWTLVRTPAGWWRSPDPAPKRQKTSLCADSVKRNSPRSGSHISARLTSLHYTHAVHTGKRRAISQMKRLMESKQSKSAAVSVTYLYRDIQHEARLSGVRHTHDSDAVGVSHAHFLQDTIRVWGNCVTIQRLHPSLTVHGVDNAAIRWPH